jgi:hypothetical protein
MSVIPDFALLVEPKTGREECEVDRAIAGGVSVVPVLVDADHDLHVLVAQRLASTIDARDLDRRDDRSAERTDEVLVVREPGAMP